MSLRKSAQPVTGQLSRELTDILTRNGMQAAIVKDASGQSRLMVQGHDSPVLTYNLTSQQLSVLTGRGSNFLNKQAYNTFTEIVAGDFDLPRNYVHARNVNNRVTMGLHGYRIGVGEYGRMAPLTPRQAFMHGMPMSFCGNPRQRGFWQVMTPWLAWTGRQQDGFHLRRMGGMLVTPQGAPIVPERPDGRIKPGELRNGGYGFYWKGGGVSYEALPPAQPSRGRIDPLEDFHPAEGAAQHPAEPLPERSREPAKPYSQLITSPVYFTAEKFQECLDSHGLLLNAEKKELTVQSAKLDVDLTYSLSASDMAALSSSSLKDHPVEERLDIINRVLAADFAGGINMDSLNSSERISIDLNEEARSELSHVTLLQEQEREAMPLVGQQAREVVSAVTADGMVIPLVSEKEGWHWQQDARHGRDVVLGNVVAYENAGRFYLRADVNGQPFTKELSASEFQDIRYRNDSRRLELVDQHLEGIHLEKGDYKGEIVNTAHTRGETLDEVSRGGKGWFREGRDGREVSVGDISVSREGAKYVMTAQIDGQTLQHEISQKDFNRFVQMDDYHRMKLFAKIFDEVDIKNTVSVGARVGAAIAATLTVMGEMAAGPEPLIGMPRGEGMMVHGHAVRPYFKPGVDSPMEIAARNFEAAMITDQIQHGLHH